MKKNMGIADSAIRLVIAAVIVVLFFSGTITGAIGIIGLVVAAVFTLTSVLSFCPLYILLSFSTCARTAKN